MVVVTGVLDHLPASEHLNEEFECRPGGRRLADRELMLDLPAEPAGQVAHYRDREAALAVDEADGPLLDAWPFLLIVRTGRIFTPHQSTLLKGRDSEGSTAGYSEFPANSQLHSVRHRTEGQSSGTSEDFLP